MYEDLVLYKCNECGWIHEAIDPQFTGSEDVKYSHCHNCFADYTEFELVVDKDSINQRRYKPGVKILVD